MFQAALLLSCSSVCVLSTPQSCPVTQPAARKSHDIVDSTHTEEQLCGIVRNLAERCRRAGHVPGDIIILKSFRLLVLLGENA